MARERIDYSRQLDPIQAPTDMGEAQLRHKAAAFNPEAGLIEYGGNLAIQAVKGKMAADLDKDVNEVLKNTLGVGVTEESIKAKWDKVDADTADKLIAHSTSEDYSGVAGVKYLTEEGEKIKAAQVQGLMTPSEAVLRIGKLVKEKSAMMPGWASEFRKVGADLTGISNIDTYGVHSLLTAKAASDKRAERLWAAQLEQDKLIANTMGVPVSEVTPQHRQAWHAAQQADFATKQLEDKVKRSNLTQQETDKQLAPAIFMKGAGAIAELSLEINKLGALFNDPNNPEKAREGALQFSQAIRQKFDALEIEVMQMTRRKEDGGAGLSEDAARRHLTDLRASFKHWEEGVKTLEGRSMFDQLVKISQGKLELLMNNFMLANPHVATLTKIGVMAELFKAYNNAEGDVARLERMFGKDLVDAMKRVVTNPTGNKQLASVHERVSTGNPPNMEELAKTDKDLALCAAGNTLECISKWSKLPQRTPEQTVALKNNFAALPGMSKAHIPGDVDKVYNTILNPDSQRALNSMSYEDRATALIPTARWVDQSMPLYSAHVKRSMDVIRQNTDASQGVTWGIELDPMTNRLMVKPSFKDGSNPDSALSRNRVRASLISKEAREELQNLRDRLDNVNKLTEVYHKSISLVNPENNMTLADIRMSAVGMLTAGATSVLAPSFADYVNQSRGSPARQTTEQTTPAPVPATPTPAPVEAPAPKSEPVVSLDRDRILRATRAAEGTLHGNNMGVSPKGAKGPFQFTDAAAKDYGLLKDGQDFRDDVAKAGEAAWKYHLKSSKEFGFGNDLEKIAAAYNAGPGSVLEAVKLATKAGAPEDWQYYLPKPRETRGYIKRFVAEYNKQS